MIRSNQNIRSENISYSFLIGKKQTWVIIVCLIFIIVLTFFPSLTNDFQMEWDDQWMLLNHPMLLDQSLENIWYYFTHFDRGQYFPLNQLYYIGIYRLFGFTPEAFHAGSFLLHLVNSGLVFILIWQWMKWIITSVNTNAILGLAALITVVFAVHPLQVEAVAWIIASKVLLYSIQFMLMGLMGEYIGKIFLQVRGKPGNSVIENNGTDPGGTYTAPDRHSWAQRNNQREKKSRNTKNRSAGSFHPNETWHPP